MSKTEQSIRRFLERHFFWIAVAVLIWISVLIRMSLADTTVSYDYTSFVKCITSFRENGLAGGLRIGLGLYFTPYNLLLALFAVLPFAEYDCIAFSSGVADYVLALFAGLTAYTLLWQEKMRAHFPKEYAMAHGAEKDGPTSVTMILPQEEREAMVQKAAFVSVLVAFLPVVWMNSALWKQCEGIYACFCMISLYYLVKERWNAAFIWFGIAFTIKLQVIFLLPLYLVLYICGKRFSIAKFLWIPVIYFIAGLPSVLAGRDIVETYTVYFRQTSAFHRMTFNYPNVYQFALTDYATYSRPAILFTFAVMVCAAYYLFRHKRNIGGREILGLAVWFQWTCVMFLPAMHDRYDYPVMVLLTVYLFLFERKKIWMAFGMNLMAIEVYCNYLYDFTPLPFVVLAAFNLVCYLLFSGMLAQRMSGGRSGKAKLREDAA
ncbi:MAG: hypothetical protein Q4C60_02425 [Eubacteriales bacterium]|nr:hypothetical protein [Eubacteriales bacterium]